MRGWIGLAIVAAALTAGCRQSEEQIRAELRSQMLQRCNSEIALKASALPGFDGAAYCGCVTDRAIGSRSVPELKTMFADRDGLSAQGRQAAGECLAQQNVNGAQQQAAADPAPADPAPAATREETPRETERTKEREKERERPVPPPPRPAEPAAERPRTPPPTANTTRPAPEPAETIEEDGSEDEVDEAQ